MIALDRYAAQATIETFLAGETTRPASEVADELAEVLESLGWVFLTAPEAPLRRVVATLLPDGTPTELRYIEQVSNEA